MDGQRDDHEIFVNAHTKHKGNMEHELLTEVHRLPPYMLHEELIAHRSWYAKRTPRPNSTREVRNCICERTRRRESILWRVRWTVYLYQTQSLWLVLV